MRRPIVAGNWKMHGSRAENARLIEATLAPSPTIAAEMRGVSALRVSAEVGRLLRDSPVRARRAGRVRRGQRRLHRRGVGGDAARTWVVGTCIVGHSERRALYGESDAAGGAQVRGRAWRSGLMPILCVGEQLARARGGPHGRGGGRAARRGAGAVPACSRLAARWSPTSRCGRSAPAAPRPRSRPRKCTPSSARGCASGDAKIAAGHAHPVRRQRQGRQCARSCSRCRTWTAD